MKENRFPYEWTLKDAKFTKDKGTVFSCFACGGGSTMGYKLAGFDVLGCNEIDPKMMEVYKANHNPKYAYLEPIQTFKLRTDLPDELYELDILDGSPPCSSFSMAGNREKDWGKEKKFREGQAEQILDNLFFDFIDLAKELQPKVVVAENVKGLLQGNAKEYVRRIYDAFCYAGYSLRISPYLLDASKMGVPQKRERVFFIAIRNDLSKQFVEQVDMFQYAPKLNLNFNGVDIIFRGLEDNLGEPINENNETFKRWKYRIKSDTSFGNITERINGKASDFNTLIIHSEKVFPTVVSKGCEVKYDLPIKISNSEYCKVGTYPIDYNFIKNKISYLIGMSVPPVMTAQIAIEIYNQWLSKLN
jgi:DNA (cytosine-5)-methyltransferase 1